MEPNAVKRLHEDAGVMTLGLIALAAFLLVGAVATLMGRNAANDEPEMPFSTNGDGANPADVILPNAPRRMGFLPAIVRESSGIARGQRDQRVWWTHNDGNDARVFAVLADGTLLGTWRLRGVEVEDVEDIATAPCPDQADNPCLYFADTGDNRQNRDEYRIVIVREPTLPAGREQADGVLETVAVVRYSYGGPSFDAEALTVLPDGSILVITKGQSGAAEIFRLPGRTGPGPGAQGASITAESLGELPVDVDRKGNRITAAAISPSGRRLAVRSDRDVTIFELPGLAEIVRCDFADAGEQGEAVDFEDETTLMLTFEAAGDGRAPIVRVTCGA
jgi:hypothetical protein